MKHKNKRGLNGFCYWLVSTWPKTFPLVKDLLTTALTQAMKLK